MYPSSQVDAILKKALQFIHKSQNKSGGFYSYSSPDKSLKTKRVRFRSIFSTALILQSLAQLDRKMTKPVIEKGVDFLQKQKSSIGTWNYWDRSSDEAQSLPYPDDLDDTFCALAALHLCDKSLITSQVLAQATKVLIAVEKKTGGPYKTWLVNKSAKAVWQDIDLVVNSNVLYFLQLQGMQLPNISRFITQQIKKGDYKTPYYPITLGSLFFLSRVVYKESQKKLLINAIQKERAKSALEYALKMLALLNLGYKKNLASLFLKLKKLQKLDGSWEGSALYTGVNPKKDSMYFSGSEALTTAFCIEAIDKYSRLFAQNEVQSFAESGYSEDIDNIYVHVLSNVKARFHTTDLHIEASKHIAQIIKNDSDRQITLLLYFFWKTLKVQKTIDLKFFVTLGEISVYGWIAYTIYDNFIDDEADIHALPIANICLREVSLKLHTLLPPSSGFSKLQSEILDIQEQTNLWEIRYCRYPLRKNIYPDFGDYQKLANKSLGHSLGCLAVLIQSGFTVESKQVKDFRNMFSHFLIARQLNDDAHDWESDLARGQINSVASLLLQTGSSDLRKQFWEVGVLDVCDLIELHIKKAKVLLKKSDYIKDYQLFEKIFDRQLHMVSLTRNEREKSLQFIQYYQATQV